MPIIVEDTVDGLGFSKYVIVSVPHNLGKCTICVTKLKLVQHFGIEHGVLKKRFFFLTNCHE